MRRRSFRLLVPLLAGSLALAACGGDDADDDTTPTDDGAEATDDVDLDLVAGDTLTVCTEVPYEPFQFEDPDSDLGYAGFDIDLMNAMAEAIGIGPITVVDTGFEGLTSGATMAAGTCDVAASAITINEERAQSVDFTDEYYESRQSLLVPVGSDVAGIDDLVEGLVVGVQSGTTGADYAEANVPGADIRDYEGGGDLFTALAAGQIDAILQDQPVNEVRADGDDGVEVVEDYSTDETYGFALEQGRDDDLLSALNAALADLRADGTYDELFDQYFAVEAE